MSSCEESSPESVYEKKTWQQLRYLISIVDPFLAKQDFDENYWEKNEYESTSLQFILN